mmetsp:Transcript_121363/g.354751  ORF Transcript_121363/g.354751 Transcript_121363/m.354751 type:complete len:222 (+) Transcript_121363:1157-1822(+)
MFLMDTFVVRPSWKARYGLANWPPLPKMHTALTKYIRTRTLAGTLLGCLKCMCSLFWLKAKESKCWSNSKDRRSLTASLVTTGSSSSSSSGSSSTVSTWSTWPGSSQPSTTLKVHFTKPKTTPGWKLQSTSLSFSLTMSWFRSRGMFLYQKSCTNGFSSEFSSLHLRLPRLSPLRGMIFTPLRGVNDSDGSTFTASMGMSSRLLLPTLAFRSGSGSASAFR